MGAILARQTKRVKIAVIGNALPLYNPPTRVAEEFAMIDVISGGRLIAGLVVGGGPEYYSFSVNPTHARAMFDEAMELVLRCWTEPGPFEHYGKFWKLKNVNPWPRPIQQPHPTVWIPGAGSQETIELVAKHRFGYMGIPYFHLDVFRKNFEAFRTACDKNGYTADPEQMGWLLPIYVAESDEQAWAEYEEHLQYFIRKLLKGLIVFPPGYTSARSMARIKQALTKFMANCETRKQLEDGGYVVVGSPDTVRQKLESYLKELGVGNLLGLFQLGTMPTEMAKRNMSLFAEQVMPGLRAALDSEVTLQTV
jgi:alkanesulfonate monooxygenase SsuD/methylene tetrahydromethanopterin reductase-like flavin-dependent oxidoreductase (luciferase family)